MEEQEPKPKVLNTIPELKDEIKRLENMKVVLTEKNFSMELQKRNADLDKKVADLEMKLNILESEERDKTKSPELKKLVKEAVKEILQESGLLVESTQKSNDMFSFKVGQHIFEGKVTKIKNGVAFKGVEIQEEIDQNK
jgi:hypothetical protein